jgi:hypothetical protein
VVHDGVSLALATTSCFPSSILLGPCIKEEVRNAYIMFGWKISEGADLVTDLSVDGEYY